MNHRAIGPMALALVLPLALSAVGACAGAKPAPTRAPAAVADYYPLREGSAWSYDVDAGSGGTVLAVTRVERVEGSSVWVRTGEGSERYELHPDAIGRPDRGGLLLQGPLAPGSSWDSGGGARATVEAFEQVVETRAGRFEGCVRVVETGGASGARIETTYCPRVGPVRVVSSLDLTHGTARVSAELRGFVIGGE
ncbi:MAG: hypothetical protein OEZ06_08660 [Myxococcales bacterium]|nr:hypothetical protein [Myxococcales bacterium]